MNNINQSSRSYEVSSIINDQISVDKIIFHEKNKNEQKYISPDSKVCLIGDGQGADTMQFAKMGVKPENISSLNVEKEEMDQANKRLKEVGVQMQYGDATEMKSLIESGIEEGSRDYVVMMHVLEVPIIKEDVEKKLVENLAKILKPDGELLVSQYKNKLKPEEAEKLGVERNEEGVLYSELSNIRTKEELIDLFKPFFDIQFEENNSEYILRMKKKNND